ncbi:hypothetical protein CPB84DRAFT_1466908 [Gymnopilus junonius]|uniref:Uncharacterized protein n=1 Tax=Gymnopilus junonius TaxID=109634 RepID=A0A9P5TKV4_GYMJU|nr:hypothetical protein CPB84DRAFT_1466908 [Gymnopilus junonius]
MRDVAGEEVRKEAEAALPHLKNSLEAQSQVEVGHHRLALASSAGVGVESPTLVQEQLPQQQRREEENDDAMKVDEAPQPDRTRHSPASPSELGPALPAAGTSEPEPEPEQLHEADSPTITITAPAPRAPSLPLSVGITDSAQPSPASILSSLPSPSPSPAPGARGQEHGQGETSTSKAASAPTKVKMTLQDFVLRKKQKQKQAELERAKDKGAEEEGKEAENGKEVVDVLKEVVDAMKVDKVEKDEKDVEKEKDVEMATSSPVITTAPAVAGASSAVSPTTTSSTSTPTPTTPVFDAKAFSEAAAAILNGQHRPPPMQHLPALSSEFTSISRLRGAARPTAHSQTKSQPQTRAGTSSTSSSSRPSPRPEAQSQSQSTSQTISTSSRPPLQPKPQLQARTASPLSSVASSRPSPQPQLQPQPRPPPKKQAPSTLSWPLPQLQHQLPPRPEPHPSLSRPSPKPRTNAQAKPSPAVLPQLKVNRTKEMKKEAIEASLSLSTPVSTAGGLSKEDGREKEKEKGRSAPSVSRPAGPQFSGAVGVRELLRKAGQALNAKSGPDKLEERPSPPLPVKPDHPPAERDQRPARQITRSVSPMGPDLLRADNQVSPSAAEFSLHARISGREDGEIIPGESSPPRCLLSILPLPMPHSTPPLLHVFLSLNNHVTLPYQPYHSRCRLRPSQ